MPGLPQKRGAAGFFFAILHSKNAVRNRKIFKNRVKGFLESIAVFQKNHLNPVQWERGRKRRVYGNLRASGEAVYFIPFLYFILSIRRKPHPPAALRQKTSKDKLVGSVRKGLPYAERIFTGRKRRQTRGDGQEERGKDTEKGKKGTVWEKADVNRPKPTWTAGAFRCYDRIGRKEKNVAFRKRMRAGFRHTGSRCSEE